MALNGEFMVELEGINFFLFLFYAFVSTIFILNIFLQQPNRSVGLKKKKKRIVEGKSANEKSPAGHSSPIVLIPQVKQQLFSLLFPVFFNEFLNLPQPPFFRRSL
jgi:hypothetical protein